MQHRSLAQQAQQQQIRGMKFISISMNNNNVEASGQLRYSLSEADLWTTNDSKSVLSFRSATSFR